MPSGHVTGPTSGDARAKTSSKKSRKVKRAKEKPEEAAEGSDLDPSKPLYPLSHYLDDFPELVEQLFKSSGNQLPAILPDILQGIPTPELKKMCVEQLEVMSRKRIGWILAGEENDNSSSSEDSMDHGSPDRNATIGQKNDNTPAVQAPDSTSFEVSDPQETSTGGSGEVKMQQSSGSYEVLELHPDSADLLLAECSGGGGTGDNRSEHVAKTTAIISGGGEVTIPDGSPSETSTDSPAPLLTKSCMDILELELRARAIKSLLKSHITPNF